MLRGDRCDERLEAWYAVWTRSHCERLVAQQLAAKGFSPFLPEVHVRRRAGSPAAARARRNAPELVPLPMFPGYLFIRDTMEKGRYIEILKVRGIVRVLEDGWTRLTPVPDQEVDAIRRLVDAKVPVSAHPHLQYGDRVRVMEGALAGVEGIFVHDRHNKGRLVVTVNLLGRSVSVELDEEAVTPIGPAQPPVPGRADPLRPLSYSADRTAEPAWM